MIAAQNPSQTAIEVSSQPKTQRLLCLESIRGIAAFVVVIHHLVYAFWPAVKHVEQASNGTSLLYCFGATPLFALHNGFFSVRLFFVLSGFVLSYPYFNSGDVNVIKSAAFRRYFRLMPPAFASILIAWLLFHFGLTFNTQALSAMGQSKTEWLGNEFLNADQMSFLGVIKQGIFDGFFRKECSLNRVLWTMPVELMGSFFVFAFLALSGELSRRRVLYIVLFLILAKTENYFFIDFLAGIILCDLYKPFFSKTNISLAVGVCVLFFGVMIGGTPAFWFRSNHIPMILGKYWPTLGASAIIVAGMTCIRLRNLLEWKCFAYLGKVSFSVYVIHTSIICSLGCYSYLKFVAAGWSHVAASLTSAVFCIIVSYLAAWPMYRYVDAQAIRFGKYLDKRFSKVTALARP